MEQLFRRLPRLLAEGDGTLDDQSASGPHARQVIRPEGEYWTITYAGQTCRLRATNGLRHLAYLLCHPHQPVPALELVRGGAVAEANDPAPGADPAATAAARERARINVTRALSATLDRLAAFHPELTRHLRATLRTGAACTYTPDPRVPAVWETDT